MASLNIIIRSIVFHGLINSLKTTRYIRWRAEMDRIFREQHPAWEMLSGPDLLPGDFLDATLIARGANFRFEYATLELIFLESDLVRVSWEPGISPPPYALIASNWPNVEVSFHPSAEGWLLSTSQLQVEIQRDGGILFYSPSRSLLRAELPPYQRAGFWVHQAKLRPEEAIYGLGEQASGLNIRGNSFHLWNTDPGGSYGPGTEPLYMPVPVYQGIHQQGSYLVFFENPNPAVFTFSPKNAERPARRPLPEDQPDQEGTEGIAEARFEGGMLRYYFIPGPPATALKRYTQLTGRTPLPPRWSLGYHQSRWGYTSERDIRKVVKGFQQHAMPVSAIHLDIDYMRGYRVFTVDEKRFPSLAGLAEELSSQGIHLVTIVDPGIKVDPDYFLYKEGLENNSYCTMPDGKPMVGLVWPGESVFPDFTDPAVRQWWGEQYPVLLEHGIAGLWHDMNEPTSFNKPGNMALPLATKHFLEGQGGDHRSGHNLYALQMNRAGFEALKKFRPERRPWIISRSGWAGQQRYAWNWTGDTESTWEALRMTIPTVLGMGLSGFAFTGPDIGGFSGNPEAELYLRHFQMATFLPFFRTHSATGTKPREPWTYGEPYTSILRQYMELRCRLLPYLYTLAWETSQTGAPLVRPLFWGDEQNSELWEVDDAFYLGDAVLIAPVLEENASFRAVKLPEGGWFNYWDDRYLSGPAPINLEVALESIPLLVRAGTILPSTDEGRLVLDIYPNEAGHAKGLVYSDAGDGYGAWRVDQFECSPQPGGVSLVWVEDQEGKRKRLPEDPNPYRGGEYPFPYADIQARLHGRQTQHAWVDGQPTKLEGNQVRIARFQEIRFDTE